MLIEAGRLSQQAVQAILLTEDTPSPHGYQYIINHPELCNTTEAIRLLIVVHSAPDHLKTRLTIRQTFGSVAARGKEVKMIFALGRVTRSDLMSKIVEEDRLYGDILQEDFHDTYRNLTLKTIMMVKWASVFCPNANYLLKIDDDCFLNPYNLLTFLEQRQTDNDHELAIFGKVFKNATPFRQEDSKWHVPVHQYPHFVFPDFAVGPSYILTRRAVPLLYRVALKTKHLVLEDVFLNGLCATKANISRINDDRFLVDVTHDLCLSKLYSITYHNVTRNEIQLLWWMIHDTRSEECQFINSTSKAIHYFNRLLNWDE